MKINANFKAMAAMNFDATKYISSPSYGVNRFMLDRIGTEKARATTIVEYKPNSSFPSHEHVGGEEFLVLSGTFKDQFGEFSAGTYVRNPIGSKHAPWVDDDGCTIFVKLLQMAETGEGTKSLHVESSKEKSTKISDGLSSLDMYHNEATGEKVQMCWLEPQAEFPVDEYCSLGEELFVFEGSLEVGGGEDYKKWGWLRFPAVSDADKKRRTLKAGSEGAQVFRKTGHLTEKALAMEKIQISEED
ncbi:MAG: hypothetical protein SGBAC_006703 [Bacillariaceae sp.]